MIGIDVALPPGWSQVPASDFEVAFVGPLEDGYRPMLGIAREPFDPPTPSGLSAGIETIRAQQAAEYDGFELLAERAVDIDGRAAYLEHFRWSGEGVPITQLLAIVVIQPGWVLKIDGACLTSLEAQHLPLLDSIVLSIETGRGAVADVA